LDIIITGDGDPEEEYPDEEYLDESTEISTNDPNPELVRSHGRDFKRYANTTANILLTGMGRAWKSNVSPFFYCTELEKLSGSVKFKVARIATSSLVRLPFAKSETECFSVAGVLICFYGSGRLIGLESFLFPL